MASVSKHVNRLRKTHRSLLPTLQTQIKKVEDQISLYQENIMPLVREAEEDYQKETGTVDDEALMQFRKQLITSSDIYLHQKDTIAKLVPASRLIVGDKESFYSWIAEEYQKSKGSPTLQAQEVIQSIKNDNPEIEKLRQQRESLQTELEHDSMYKEIQALEKIIKGEEKAIISMQNTIAQKQDKMSEEKRSNIIARQKRLENEIPAHKEELQALKKSLPLLSELENILEKLENMKISSGLLSAELQLKVANKEMGAQSKSSGSSFEQVSRMAILHLIVPDYCTEEEMDIINNEKLLESTTACHLLHSATLGMHAAEIDYLLVRGEKIVEKDLSEKDRKKILNNSAVRKEKRRKLGDQEPNAYYNVTEVLAVIECKANARDILHNIPRMQAMMSWLTGDKEKKSSHDSDAFYHDITWKTTYFSRGEFDKPTGHVCSSTNTVWIFQSPDCFSGLTRDTDGIFRRHLYYTTKRGMIGLPRGTAKKILSRCIFQGVDLNNLSSQHEALEDIRQWCLKEFEDYDRSFRILDKVKESIQGVRVFPFAVSTVSGDSEEEEDDC